MIEAHWNDSVKELNDDLRWQSAKTKFIKNHLPRPAQ